MSGQSMRANGEQGAILVHVAVGLLMLVALSAFAVDFGILWQSRREAQNAADAGAIAGAIALGFDDPNDQTDSGPAKQSAVTAAQLNQVWGQAPSVVPATDVTFPVCPDGTASCVRVDVYRNTTRGNPLPVIFGGLAGLVSQNIKATATAESRAANSTACLKPWIIPDKWMEHYPVNPGTWDPERSTFDTTSGNGRNQRPLPNPDVYIPPSAGDSMTGFRATGTPNDIGTLLTLRQGPPARGQTGAAQPGWVYPVRLNEAEAGGDIYRENIQFCSGDQIKVGDWLRNETGIMVGPTFQGVDPLLAADSSAEWVDPDGPGGVPGHIENSCQNTNSCSGPYAPSSGRSPRVIAIPVFNTATFSQTPGAEMLQVVNIIGIFLKERNGNSITGYLTPFPGEVASAGGTVPESAAFSHTIVLVR